MKNTKTEPGSIGEARCEHLVKRNRLISLMLQDRGVVRLICAPHGFGKSLLAHEYATRLFAGEEVRWVDASQPDFLIALDDGWQGRELNGGAGMGVIDPLR